MTLPAVHFGNTQPLPAPYKRAPSPNAHEDLSSTPSSPGNSNTSSLNASPPLSRTASPAPNAPHLATQGSSRGTNTPRRLADAGHRFLRNFQSILAKHLASLRSNINSDPARIQAQLNWQTLTEKLQHAIDRFLGNNPSNPASDNPPPNQLHEPATDVLPYHAKSFEIVPPEQQAAPPSLQQHTLRHTLPPLFNPSTALRVDGGFGPESTADLSGLNDGPKYLHANQVRFSNRKVSTQNGQPSVDFSLAQLPHSPEALDALIDRAVCLHQKEGKIEPWVVMINDPTNDYISSTYLGLQKFHHGKPYMPIHYKNKQGREYQFNQPVFFVKAPLNKKRCMTAKYLMASIDQYNMQISHSHQNYPAQTIIETPIFFSYAGVGRNAALATCLNVLETLRKDNYWNISDEDILSMMDKQIEAMRRDRGPLVIPNFDQYWEIACTIRQTVDRVLASQQNIA